jgi:hypothetical protein
MANLKDIFTDIAKYTNVNGIEYVKVYRDKEDRIRVDAQMGSSLVINGKIKDDVAEIDQDLGLANLGFLKSLVNLPNYQETGTVTIQKKDDGVIDRIEIKDADKNTDIYRFMSSNKIQEHLSRLPTFRGTNWDISFSPNTESLKALSTLNSLYGSIESNFTLSVEDDNLVMNVIGQQGSFFGKRKIAKSIGGTLKTGHQWPLGLAHQIMTLCMSGNCLMQVSEKGVVSFSVDTGITEYNYYIQAQSIS